MTGICVRCGKINVENVIIVITMCGVIGVGWELIACKRCVSYFDDQLYLVERDDLQKVYPLTDKDPLYWIGCDIRESLYVGFCERCGQLVTSYHSLSYCFSSKLLAPSSTNTLTIEQ